MYGKKLIGAAVLIGCSSLYAVGLSGVQDVSFDPAHSGQGYEISAFFGNITGFAPSDLSVEDVDITVASVAPTTSIRTGALIGGVVTAEELDISVMSAPKIVYRSDVEDSLYEDIRSSAAEPTVVTRQELAAVEVEASPAPVAKKPVGQQVARLSTTSNTDIVTPGRRYTAPNPGFVPGKGIIAPAGKPKATVKAAIKPKANAAVAAPKRVSKASVATARSVKFGEPQYQIGVFW